MPKIIKTIAGNTQQVTELRKQIRDALQSDNEVKVHLLQPGIMYEEEKSWYTVVDFINEWEGSDISFYSNMVPLRPIRVKYTYVNDMFFYGNRLYIEDPKCISLLSKIRTDYCSRKYSWELLFGRKNVMKDNLFFKMKQHSVCDKIYHTYFGENTGAGKWSEFVVTPKQNSAESIGHNTVIRCSDLIDPEIYNQTYYSAVIETVVHNDFAMFSEKEAKPIMAKRPFVIFGSRHHLKAFRSLGFKSFGHVIDERYDEITDDDQRFQAVLDAMQELSRYDPRHVYEKLNEVLEHNKKHFLYNNWTKI